MISKSSLLSLILVILIGAGTYLTTYLQNTANRSQYENWKSNYAMNFEFAFEDAYRQLVFYQNLQKIKQHNSNIKRTYDMGINKFTGLTEAQFAQIYLSKVIVKQSNINSNTKQQVDIRVGDVDWVAQGAVTAVKDEGHQCGACWAFAAIGVLQSLNKIANGQLQRFSQQQLIDCSSKYGNYGCNGGYMTNSYKYVKDNGITLQQEYPYKGMNQKCIKNQGKFKISGYTEINNCNDLANALTQRPISVIVDATQWSAYKSGILTDCKTSLNFAAVLVGVTTDYWKVKNCWSTSWGENGYIRLARGNTCGICTQASYALK